MLGWSVWAPIANISYSLYLNHLDCINWATDIFSGYTNNYYRAERPFDDIATHKVHVLWGSIVASGFIVSCVVSLFGTYLLLEKPVIDARRTFRVDLTKNEKK